MVHFVRLFRSFPRIKCAHSFDGQKVKVLVATGISLSNILPCLISRAKHTQIQTSVVVANELNKTKTRAYYVYQNRLISRRSKKRTEV